MTLHHLSALEISEKVRKGELSAVQVTEFFLARAERINPDVGAFLQLLKEQALQKAAAVDAKRAAGKPLGKLAGVPVGIKDNIHIAGEITTCASKFLTNYRAPFAATAVRLIEEADGIPLGKTNLDEFAMGSSTEHSALLTTKNPWNLACSPGGSSGGSAVAVAARMCPLAIGSDTGGSIRQPGSLCGIVGMKPTYGRVSRYGLVAFGSSLDQIGPFATTVKDAALAMEVMGRHCAHDATSLPLPAEELVSACNGTIKGKRIGVPYAFLEQLAAEPRALFDEAIKVLTDQGATCIEVDLSLQTKSIAVYYILATAEASTNLARFDGIRYGRRSEEAQTLAEVYDLSRRDGFGAEVKRRIMLGTYVLSAGYQDAYYKKAQRVRTLMIQEMQRAFEFCDAIAMPVSPCAAFERGVHKDPLQEYLEDLYTIAANLTGVPALSVPAGFTKAGLPVGLQLLTTQKDERTLFQIADAYERVTRHGSKMPELAQK